MSSFEIRPATESDVGVVLSFIRALAEYERRIGEVVATEELLREHLFGTRPVAEALLAFWGEETVGFALFHTNFSTFLGRPGLHLEDVFVKPEFRGRSFGKALVLHVARLAWERRCGRLEWTVLDWNAPAIQFYEKLGARVLPDWRVCRMEGASLESLAGLTWQGR